MISDATKEFLPGDNKELSNQSEPLPPTPQPPTYPLSLSRLNFILDTLNRRKTKLYLGHPE